MLLHDVMSLVAKRMQMKIKRASHTRVPRALADETTG
jgi:hypothetical protein